MLFSLIAMRMAGFVFLNPVLGRKNIPALVKSGLAMVLTVAVYSTALAKGMAVDVDISSPIVYSIVLLKEFAVGYVLGFVMQLFDMVMTYAGAVIDFQLGISMATVYDAQSGAQIALSGNILQIFYLLLFFAVDGHLALMKILMTSGEAVPFGAVALSANTATAVLDIFVQCVVLAVKLSFPLIAFEFVVEIGLGILMKINPQVNLFVLSIQLRLFVGLVLLAFLVSPIGEYIGGVVSAMLRTMENLLQTAAG